MNSPLKQVNLTPSAHRPKAASLYDNLFKTQDHLPGFWVEFFILPLSRTHLLQVLESEPREAIVTNPVVLETLFQAGASNMEASDWFIVTNSLEILAVVLGWLLDQKFPSQEIIAAIAPVEKIDKVFDELSRGLMRCLAERPNVSLEFLLWVLPKAAGTRISTFFSSKNMFRPLINLIDTEYAAKALTLVGIFCLLNKREDHVDPYKERITDFIDEDATLKICGVFGRELGKVSTAPQRTWLSYFQKHEPAQIQLAPLPIMHTIYEFCLHNELFAVQCMQQQDFSVPFFAVATQIAQNQHLGEQYRNYAIVVIFILRVLVERNSSLSELCSPSNQQIFLVSQDRSPHMSLCTSPQVPMAAVLDTVQCCLRFNVRKKFDHEMYSEVLQLLLVVTNALKSHSFRMSYDWQQLWRTLFSVLNHMSKQEVVGDAGNCLLLLQSITLFSLSPSLVGDGYISLIQKASKSKELISKFNLKYGLSGTPSAKSLSAMIDQYELVAQDTVPHSDSDTAAQVAKQGQHVLGDASLKQGKFSEYSRRKFFAQETRTLLAGVAESVNEGEKQLQ